MADLSNTKLRSRIYNHAITPQEIIGQKSHFIIERWGNGWAINVKRRGQPLQTILCDTPGELNRERQKISDAGLIGYAGGSA